MGIPRAAAQGEAIRGPEAPSGVPAWRLTRPPLLRTAIRDRRTGRRNTLIKENFPNPIVIDAVFCVDSFLFPDCVSEKRGLIRAFARVHGPRSLQQAWSPPRAAAQMPRLVRAPARGRALSSPPCTRKQLGRTRGKPSAVSEGSPSTYRFRKDIRT